MAASPSRTIRYEQGKQNMRNPEYTSLWTDQFSADGVRKYDNKFKVRWEKHIKHREQIEFIGKYLEEWMYWCDAPIGSGRLMSELQSEKMLGFDISDHFLEYNRKKGIQCVKGDLFEFGDCFSNQFDFVTSLHTIPAFLEFRKILEGFVNSLRSGGILIVDLVNKLHSEKAPDLLPLLVDDPDKYPKGMDRDEIWQFFEGFDCEILEIRPHDFWDNYYILNWRHYSGNWITKRIRKYLWSSLKGAYFAFGLYGVLHSFELDQPDHRFTKYLVAVQKR